MGMTRKPVRMRKFQSESEEADWWGSRAGRAYVKQKSAEARSKGGAKGTEPSGSRLVAALNIPAQGMKRRAGQRPRKTSPQTRRP